MVRPKPGAGFGQRLVDLRNAAKKRQEDVAHDLKVSVATYARWERGENDPPGERIAQLARYYKVTVDHLVLGKPNELQTANPAFHRFLATDYGRIAVQRNWINFLLTADYPFEPTVKLYKALVHALLMYADEDEGESR